jgi:hypothetical protein
MFHRGWLTLAMEGSMFLVVRLPFFRLGESRVKLGINEKMRMK